MKQILARKPILHAVLWIMIYVVLVNLGGVLMELTNSSQLPTAILLSALTITLILYIKRNKRIVAIEIRRVTKLDMKKTLFYLPLILMSMPQFFAGINHLLSTTNIALFCILMIGVGFVEEIIFRGFLYQGINGMSGTNRAILISGVTFGFGHIVNLLRGYDITALGGQILIAIILGVVLALLVAVTKNLLPGILFHIMFNIGGTITNPDPSMQNYLLIFIVIVATMYAIFLFKLVRDPHDAKTSPVGSSSTAKNTNSVSD